MFNTISSLIEVSMFNILFKTLAIINENPNTLAIINDNKNTSNNLNYIIGGLFVIVIILVANILFSKK